MADRKGREEFRCYIILLCKQRLLNKVREARTLNFIILNIYSRGKCTGNQLAVCTVSH